MALATSPLESAPTFVPRWRDLLAARWFCVLVLSLWCGLLFFYGLDGGELWRTEGLRAIIAQEMLRSGNWIVPTLYGQPLFTKPPGMYAAIALLSWPFGVTESSARLPSALAATATVVLFFWYFSRNFGRPWGLAAALILPMSPMWLDKASAAEIDMLQVFWVTASILFFLRALEAQLPSPLGGEGLGVRGESEPTSRPSPPPPLPQGERGRSFGWWLAALLCVAGGVLTKWTAPVFFYLTAITLLWQRRQLHLLFGWRHLVSAAAAAGLCICWMGAAIHLAGWDIFYTTLMREALYRLVPNYGEEPYHWHEVPLHPLVIFATNLPWSIVALWTLRPGFFKRWGPQQQDVLRALHCWLWPSLLFFSLVTEHTPRHSFPFFPAIAGLAVMACIAFANGSLSCRWQVSPVKAIIAWVIVWVMLKIAYVELVMPRRNTNRDPRAKGELLAARVPGDAILYLLKLKDEGIMFYYNRPIRRLDSVLELPKSFPNVYCILKVNEWGSWQMMFEMDIIERLRDQQGDEIMLVRVLGRKRPG